MYVLRLSIIFLPGRVFLALSFFPFNCLYHGSLSLSGLQSSARKSGYSLIGVPLCVTNCFSLAFEILSLSLISEEQGFSLPPEIKAPPQNEIKEVEIGKKTIRIL